MWEKELWLAKRKGLETDENGIQYETFEDPIKLNINYQPISGYTDYLEYGEKMHDVYRAYVNASQYEGLFEVGDRLYLIDGQIKQSELQKIALYDNKYRNRANYVVHSVLPQNYKIKIEFMKRRNVMAETIKMVKDGVVKYVDKNLEQDYAKLGWKREEETTTYNK